MQGERRLGNDLHLGYTFLYWFDGENTTWNWIAIRKISDIVTDIILNLLEN